MKNKRMEKIIEIIRKNEIGTQDDLINRLQREGFRVTQATVSRDIRELGLSKVTTASGAFRYVLPARIESRQGGKFNTALSDSITGVSFAGNIIVFKTYPGMAQAVATGIDALDIPDCLGCVAGDDTIIAVARNAESAVFISEKIENMMKIM